MVWWTKGKSVGKGSKGIIKTVVLENLDWRVKGKIEHRASVRLLSSWCIFFPMWGVNECETRARRLSSSVQAFS